MLVSYMGAERLPIVLSRAMRALPFTPFIHIMLFALETAQKRGEMDT